MIAPIPRREFLADSSASFVAAAAGAPARTAPDQLWYPTMRRCGQLNLNERDPLTLDVGSWIDYWASLKLDALLLSGGGLLAFYPTQVPYHHPRELLRGGDLFRQLAAPPTRRAPPLAPRH